jgi:hypothetical protein
MTEAEMELNQEGADEMLDWARPMTDSELYQEAMDYEFGARYDRWDGYGEPDYYTEDYDDAVFGCGFQEREEAAAYFCKALFALRAVSDDEIPF